MSPDVHDHTHSHTGDEQPRGKGPTSCHCPGCRICEGYKGGTADQKPRSGDTHQGPHIDHSGHEEMFKRRFIVCFLLSLPVLYYSHMLQEWFSYTAYAFPGSDYVGPVLGTVIFLYGGLPFLRMGAIEAENHKPGMMLLISLAIVVAFVYSLGAAFFDIGEPLFWELVTLIVIFQLGHWIEMRSVRRASGALDELAGLIPSTAERLTDSGEIQEVLVDDLMTDDLVLVRPGGNIPADGIVQEGESDVNEAMITGESTPVRKESGDRVIGGTINQDGSLRVRITATGDETTLSGIMRLVYEAQQSRSHTQILADRAAGWLFYAAIAVAAVTAVAWTIAVGFGIIVIERVVTVLVIACPHALGLAIPLVVAINTSLAASNGMLIRNRIAMEEARRLDTIVFDKTGTLTRGEQGVVDLISDGSKTEDDVLALMAAAEGDSEHSISRAIRSEAGRRGVSIPAVSGFETLKGRGIRVTVSAGAGEPGDGNHAKMAGDSTVYVGGPNLLSHLALTPGAEIQAFSDAAASRGEGVMYLIMDDAVIGAAALADIVRPESYEAVTALQEMGITVAILTGDSRAVAEKVAKELGVEIIFAEVLPEDKDQKIIELQNQGRFVAMVGDGVNDAPALIRADVGIAIGSGTDVAIESADVILIENDPRDVVSLIHLSRRSYRKMQENLVWAAGYNVVALPLAAGILAPVGIMLSPAVGAVLMSASTVIVAANAQLLRRVKL
ncbi:Cu2+-exporting ATPase [Methanocalculus alkaliphilus]|uniref:heavy metal translocating P-type ATPase n=1 Tax=Methanocalculus alkaliphilus TaxID=768730 RepID=UPI00209E4FFA|nr:heavy metal translocating P-type ATPase [Methanocalculus alkaliphilus]MCP1716228.1 Cu2+-exporting ATPase [Methanocalculus alkaliphilus]